MAHLSSESEMSVQRQFILLTALPELFHSPPACSKLLSMLTRQATDITHEYYDLDMISTVNDVTYLL